MAVKPRKKRLYKFTAFYEPAEEGGYVVTIPALPGCVTQGETFEEASRMARDAIKGYVALLRAEGLPIPKENDATITAPLFIPVFSCG